MMASSSSVADAFRLVLVALTLAGARCSESAITGLRGAILTPNGNPKFGKVVPEEAILTPNGNPKFGEVPEGAILTPNGNPRFGEVPEGAILTPNGNPKFGKIPEKEPTETR